MIKDHLKLFVIKFIIQKQMQKHLNEKGNFIMKKTALIIMTVAIMLCMCLPIVAADVPSAEVPEAPEIMDAIINKGDEDQKEATVDVTTLEQAKQESTTVGDALIEAFEKFDKNPTVSVPALKDFKTGTDFENPVFSVTHAFAIEVENLEEGASVTISFKNDFGAKQGSIIVIHQNDEGEWLIVPADKVVVSSATIDVTFDSLCPVMFLSVEEAKDDAPVVDPDQPDNSVMIATIVIVCVTVVIVGGIVVFYVLEKKGVFAKFTKK